MLLTNLLSFSTAFITINSLQLVHVCNINQFQFFNINEFSVFKLLKSVIIDFINVNTKSGVNEVMLDTRNYSMIIKPV